MSEILSVKTATEWFALWKATEEQIEEEYSKFAGLKVVYNEDDKIEFDKRIEALTSLAERYEKKYRQAYKYENGGKKTGRLLTYNNGL